MEAPFPGKLRIWPGWSPAAAEPAPAADLRHLLAGPHHPAEFTERLYACEALNPPTGRPPTDEGTEPYTLQWFLNIESQRHGRQGRWIPRLLEFSKHPGETLLGLGSGLGTDWIQYARHGAYVVVCSPSAEQLALVQRNFELRGLHGRFLHTAADSLPLESASIDVVCASSLFEAVRDAGPVVEEIYRVLKPGGKVLAVAPARFDVDFWASWCSPWQAWLRRAEPAPAYLMRYSRRGLRRLFTRFIEHRIHKRQLRRSEVPPLWRWAPLPVLERLLGHVLVLKAFKPLSAAMAVQMAA
jgi:SAM-dependent methyltransferase